MSEWIGDGGRVVDGKIRWHCSRYPRERTFIVFGRVDENGERVEGGKERSGIGSQKLASEVFIDRALGSQCRVAPFIANGSILVCLPA